MESKRTILLADDDPFITELYHSKLTREGFNVYSVNDGEQALLKIDSLQPDLLILDLNMPRMDGLEVLRYIRSRAAGGDMPVIVLSNACTESMMAEVWKLKPTRFLTKRESKPNNVMAEIRAIFAKTPAGSPPPLVEPSRPPPVVARPVEAAPLAFDIQVAKAAVQRLWTTPDVHERKEALLNAYKMVHDKIETLRMGDPRKITSHVGRAFESFYDHLYAHPQQINASSCRTLLQATGCLPLAMHDAPDDDLASSAATRVLIMAEDDTMRASLVQWMDRPGFHPVATRDMATAVMLTRDNRFDLALLDAGKFNLLEKTVKRLQADDIHRPPLIIFLLQEEHLDEIDAGILDEQTDAALLPPMKQEIELKIAIFKLTTRRTNRG